MTPDKAAALLQLTRLESRLHELRLRVLADADDEREAEALTVRGGQPTSHADKGWEHFTDAAIKAVNDSPYCVVFVLWGAYARKKAVLVRNPQHVVLEAGHPSPMNPRGFLGCRHFSQIHEALAKAGRGEVSWV